MKTIIVVLFPELFYMSIQSVRKFLLWSPRFVFKWLSVFVICTFAPMCKCLPAASEYLRNKSFISYLPISFTRSLVQGWVFSTDRLSRFLLIAETLINLKEKDKSVKLESLLYLVMFLNLYV